MSTDKIESTAKGTSTQPKQCPECGKVFRNRHNGWSGIDGHWRSDRVGHDDVMSYEDALPLILASEYVRGW